MGCGQSKINLYPRRNKNGGKTNSAKKSGAADKEADEEEGTTASGGGESSEDPADEDRGKHLLPLTTHPATVEISASQQDFFKMLDEKIENGKDYDSSSETEVKLERERRRTLIQQWRSASHSSQSIQSAPSPPTPVRRRTTPVTPPDTRSPATIRRCCRINGDRDWQSDSPKRTTTHWRNNPKVAPYAGKKKGLDANDNRAETDTESSPAQPYIAQIVTYPISQQVATQSPYIAPPEPYQDLEESRAPLYYVPTTPHPDQIAQQRHQTALHLQQYVAMKQAQQNMFNYYQRTPLAIFPDELSSEAMGVVRPNSAPGRGYVGGVWGSSGYYRGESEFQYYPPQLVLRPGSAGTIPRSVKTDREVPGTNSCQSLNMVRAKPVGQVVCGPELTVVTPHQAPSTEPPDKRPRPLYARTLKNSKSLDST